MINNAGTPKELELKNQIQKYLERNLNSNKVVVFIDDLDRIDDGNRIIDLLKWLKGLVNFKGFIFLIGVDHNIVKTVIEKKLFLNGDNDFLEKIIDYPIYLPKLIDNEIETLLESELEKLEELNYDIKKEAIYDIEEYLPNNPRALKRFLRYLGILNPTLNRFYDDELVFFIFSSITWIRVSKCFKKYT
ncbi:P-loop NTPase fold protein [Orenia marismortui]|uniref:P-loop NTPase fold protein n=1 Tax=Orenia marismortui TaxID=46469 RepID=UPI001416F515|nr:P-loop NTPase fold protein [Orenia marismortui]